MKKIEKLIWVLFIILFIVIIVLTNEKILYLEDKNIELEKQLITLKSELINTNNNIGDVVNYITIDQQKQKNQIDSLERRFTILRDQVNNNTIMSHEWGEDIFRLHRWYWESDEGKKKIENAVEKENYIW